MNTATQDYIPIETLKVSAFKIPTDSSESDGTLTWDSTLLVLVEVTAGGKIGLGYTYADTSVATLIHHTLSPIIVKKNALAVKDNWVAMHHAIRNLGSPGIASMAISAVDIGLWDLKAKILQLPLAQLFDQVHSHIPIYGSGGFTSYTNKQLQEQLEGWLQQGITRFKIKVGRDDKKDIERVILSRKIIGPNAELFVDANGAYTRKKALYMADFYADMEVTWFEEPVSSDDLSGLHLIRNRAPRGMEISAGEYGYDQFYFMRMLEHEAVDVMQADATRCGGFTGFLNVGALCQSKTLTLSSHTAPQLHLHACSALVPLRHLEYFHDHVRIESLLFEGIRHPEKGYLSPNLKCEGMGLQFKYQDAAAYKL